MTDFTPFDCPDKATLISYLNEEQPEELANFIHAFFEKKSSKHFTVRLTEIYQQGLLLQVKTATTTSQDFIAFIQPIYNREDFQQQYIILVQQSAKMLGKATIKLTSQEFSVVDSYFVTANMFRLVLTTHTDLSYLSASYAYLFKTETANTSSKNSRNLRYYTLRKAWQQKEDNGEVQNFAWVDIFLHEDKEGNKSLGETWATSRIAGDTITTEREFPEKIEHLATGQALLIADETSLPTIARLLETWQNPLPPVVVVLSQHSAEQAYLTHITWDNLDKSSVIFLPIEQINNQSPHEQIFATLQDFLSMTKLKIDKVWGGFEATTTKKLRPLLLEYLNLTRDNMVIKVYWRAENP